MTRLDSLLWRERSTIERHDSKDGSEVTYEFPLGFCIKATAKGILFAGSSVNYNLGSIILVEEVIKWSQMIHLALRLGKGVPPQAECEGKLVLKSKDKKAWWKGQFKDAIVEMNGVPASMILRKQVREKEIIDFNRPD